MSARSIAAAIIVCLAALCLHLALPMTARAQAWLPLRGTNLRAGRGNRVRNHSEDHAQLGTSALSSAG